MPLISIIVPCYNVELYIDRCVNSLVHQTIGIENLEIILVNDASTDSTLDKIREWEQKYPDNILVITYEENIRQGGARNVGLQYATGEYIGFVDSDDWVELNMYEELLKGIREEACDVAQCKYFRDDGTVCIGGHGSGKREVIQFEEKNGFFWADEYKEDETEGIYGGIVTRLFKRKLIYEHSIVFPEKMAYEDNYWLGITNLYIRNTCYIDKLFYHYWVNTNSTVMTRNANYHLQRIEIETKLLDEYIERGAFKSFYVEILESFIERFYLNTYFIMFTRYDVVPDIYQMMRKIILLYFPDWKEKFDEISPKLIEENPLLTILAEKENCSVEELKIAFLDMLRQNGLLNN